ncbi:MAG: phospholipid carrier-dependent glycosyltransferase [Candidatus Atribacteria bacterium]|nr:phospholipid carrier-dependent glycosyltransferase [Candidatus Atribacteria bacterium]
MKKWLSVFLLTIFSLGISLYNLGSRKVPETFWEPRRRGETIIVDLGEVATVGRISFFGGIIRQGTYRVEYSEDNAIWNEGPIMKPEWVFRWEHCDGMWRGRYFKIIVDTPRGMLNEVGFFEVGKTSPLSVQSVSPASTFPEVSEGFKNLFDEQNTVQYVHSYLTGTYFDEIYHARTAYEHLHRLEPYEWTHPPLGKIIIAPGIALFGMNPFGFRIMGVIFGTLLIPLFYLLARRLLGKEKYALFVTFLFTFEFMRFVQARIATIDTYVVFFILGAYYFLLRYLQRRDRVDYRALFLSGIFFGCGAATKWTVIYAGLGMMVLFLLDLTRRFREEVWFKEVIWRKLLPFCVLSFILIPVSIYALSYIPYILVPGHDISDIWRYQGQMYHYHKDLKATHPFASPWWQWPAIIRPIWLYQGEGLPKGMISSIVSMGNPAIWWLGALLLLALLFFAELRQGSALPFILLGFFSQYVPWVLVPRITFIYHYYGCVPFLILLVGVFFQRLEERSSPYARWIWVYGLAVVVLFTMFYPILSGAVVSQSYVGRFLQWLPSWVFYVGG